METKFNEVIKQARTTPTLIGDQAISSAKWNKTLGSLEMSETLFWVQIDPWNQANFYAVYNTKDGLFFRIESQIGGLGSERTEVNFKTKEEALKTWHNIVSILKKEIKKAQ